MKPIHVATIASEMVPLAKTGGLGDVCGSLPVALDKLGCQCTGFLPAYRSVFKSGLAIESTDHTFTIPINRKFVACRLLRTRLPDSRVDVYLIDQPQYFDREGLYSDAGGEYRDSCERFCFFCQAVLAAIDQLQLTVDIAHCHDWQAGLIPAYIKTRHHDYAWLKRARSVMTIHNLAYQGRFWHLDMPLTGLSWDHFHWREMEFHGQLNLMKTGIVFADRVTTVSPTYAREITTPEHGCGLEGTLSSRGGELVGIVNGVDYAQWDPERDPHLPSTFGLQDWQQGKAVCKRSLQKELGLESNLETPLIGIVSRLVDQKGWDLIIPLLTHWAQNRDVQWAILGTGNPRYEQALGDLARQHPQRLAARLQFSEALAHRIEASSDLFLMPSRYEPCGLNQLYSLKYGSVPVVNATGGLADTVTNTTDLTLAQRRATGFCFYDYNLARLEETLSRAVDFYLHKKELWTQIVESGMSMDWSWNTSAESYIDVYRQTLEDRT